MATVEQERHARLHGYRDYEEYCYHLYGGRARDIVPATTQKPVAVINRFVRSLRYWLQK